MTKFNIYQHRLCCSNSNNLMSARRKYISKTGSSFTSKKKKLTGFNNLNNHYCNYNTREEDEGVSPYLTTFTYYAIQHNRL